MQTVIQRAISFVLIIACIALSPVELRADDEMQTVLQDVTRRLTDAFETMSGRMAKSARELQETELSGNNSDALIIIEELSGFDPAIIGCAILSNAGEVVAIAPSNVDLRVFNTGSASSHQFLVENMKPVFTLFASSSPGTGTIVCEYPVIKDGALLGSVSLAIKADEFIAKALSSMPKYESCAMWIVTLNGLLMYDNDPEQIGRNIFSDNMFKSFQSLVAFTKKVVERPQGVGKYIYFARGYEDRTPVPKNGIWDTVSINSLVWRIVVVKTEA